MDSSPSWLPGLTERLGPLEVVASPGPRLWRVRSPHGDMAVKTGPAVADEGAGLSRLDAVDGLRVPRVVHCGDDVLVTEWVKAGRRGPQHDVQLGRALARLHSTPVSQWGGGSAWTGECPVDPAPRPDGPSFYGGRLAELGRRCGLGPEVEAVAAGLPDLLPPGGPALLHGDLWWGNVLWSPAGPVLIDPSVHGGHPEEDLAMLALFGTVPASTLSAYGEIRPMEPGWEERVALFQLYPLLVHSVLFGGAYVARARLVALRYAR